MTKDNEPGQMILDFKSGNLTVNREKLVFCKFSNLEALGIENTEDVASDDLKLEQNIEDKCITKIDVDNYD